MRALFHLAWIFTIAPFVIRFSTPTSEWPTYRSSQQRTGTQPIDSLLSSTCSKNYLALDWTWPPSGSEHEFKASPIVFSNTVFIGSTGGVFYALAADTGIQRWHFPDPDTGSGNPLKGSCGGFGNYGIQSSATSASIQGQQAVIFGAPDPTAEGGLGSARLYALNAGTGRLIWKSDVVAHVTGCTASSANNPVPNEFHERIAFSSPLVFGSMVYVGVHDAGDDPIMNGKVVAVDLNTGRRVPGFSYVSTSTRGGGVWNSPATDGQDVYFTTGNTRTWAFGAQPEPPINNGLSLLRVNPLTGAIAWKFQPVPYPLDFDPDWSAGAAVVQSSCGTVVESVQKDGWAYAVNASDGTCKWQFPPTASEQGRRDCKFSVPSGCRVLPDGNVTDACPRIHGDFDYKQPGATWGDVFVVETGGWNVDLQISGDVNAGYTRLHALNTCADDTQRVRWIKQIPPADTNEDGYPLGAPTITGGVVYVTTNKGHVIAIADPTVYRFVDGYQCSFDAFNPGTFPDWQSRCIQNGYQIVPSPALMADFTLPDGANATGHLRSEPAIANGRLFVATSGGHVYALKSNVNPYIVCGNPGNQ